MDTPARSYRAEYYDAITTQTNDITFYEALVTPESRVLELGCGSGRVGIPLARRAKSVVGVDRSETMIAAARAKQGGATVRFLLGDITALQLGEQFDLVIAPYRVLQALEHDREVSGLMATIREHLAPEGTAILNTFMPKYARDEWARVWCVEHETDYMQVTLPDGDVLKVSDTRRRVDAARQVIYPELIHRRYHDGVLIDEHVNPICMRYYYPEQLLALVTTNGFAVTRTWGGYDGQAYGEGPELVVAFTHA